MAQNIYNFKVKNIKGEDKSLKDYEGKVLLIVNVASKCGFTPQYKELEEMHKELSGKGLCILGFPCNQFGAQEPGSEQDIQSFCSTNYGVTFDMFSKVEVNGPNENPLYGYLKEACPGILNTTGIKWNFTKFLIDKEGKAVKRFAPNDKPFSIIEDIEKLLP